MGISKAAARNGATIIFRRNTQIKIPAIRTTMATAGLRTVYAIPPPNLMCWGSTDNSDRLLAEEERSSTEQLIQQANQKTLALKPSRRATTPRANVGDTYASSHFSSRPRVRLYFAAVANSRSAN